MMPVRPLMETNVYSLRGKVLIVGACLPELWPEAFEALAAGGRCGRRLLPDPFRHPAPGVSETVWLLTISLYIVFFVLNYYL